jgi:hypothetical protein
VAGAADLKEDPVLTFQLDLFVVQPARQVDGSVEIHELVGTQPAVVVGCLHLGFGTRSHLPYRF